MQLLKSNKWFKVMVAALLATVLSLGIGAMYTQQAFAADSQSDITVNVESGGSTVYSSTVTYDQLSTAGKIGTDDLGFLFCRHDVWNVVGTDNYVKVGDLFNQAGVGAIWAAAPASTEVHFTCSDGAYTKYYPTKAEIDRPQYFYPETTASATNDSNHISTYAVIAYNTNSSPITGAYKASDILPNVLSGGTQAPRFCMGLVSENDLGDPADEYDVADYTNSLAMGKRMPSVVTEITIVL